MQTLQVVSGRATRMRCACMAAPGNPPKPLRAPPIKRQVTSRPLPQRAHTEGTAAADAPQRLKGRQDSAASGAPSGHVINEQENSAHNSFYLPEW